jgi:hypothetical protein
MTGDVGVAAGWFALAVAAVYRTSRDATFRRSSDTRRYRSAADASLSCHTERSAKRVVEVAAFFDCALCAPLRMTGDVR